MILRLLDAGDAAAAGALVAEGDVPPPYVDRLREVLDGVFSGDDEHLALGGLADDAGASRLAGVVLHGMVAGAIGTGALRGVLVARQWRRRGVGRALVERASGLLFARGARLVVAEVPADPALDGVRALLERCAYREEARVPDLVRDGVALTFLRRERPPG